jgi:hypothetical protein
VKDIELLCIGFPTLAKKIKLISFCSLLVAEKGASDHSWKN